MTVTETSVREVIPEVGGNFVFDENVVKGTAGSFVALC